MTLEGGFLRTFWQPIFVVCIELSLNFLDFHIYIDVLYLGGPQLFQGGLPAYYSFDDNSSPKINIIVFGVPQPIVEGEFIYQKLNVLNKSINTYTHNFTLELPQMTQKACGKELTVIATGYNGTLIEKIKVFVENCKYLYVFLISVF